MGGKFFTNFDRRSENSLSSRVKLPQSQVQDCLFAGKGGEVFDGLHYVPVRMGGSNETYVDAGRKRLVLDVSDNHTRVAFSSDVPATFAELDILSWCVNNPDLTWIPRELR